MKSSKFLFYFKNGSDAEIRSPKESDVESVISYLFKTASETEFIYRYPEETWLNVKYIFKLILDTVNNYV